jgi:hypothetical protein
VINSSVAFCGGIDTRDGGVLSLSNSSVDGQSSSGMLTGSNGAIVQSKANQFVNDTPGYVFNFENSQAISSRDLFSGAGQGIYLRGSKFTLDEAVIGGASFDDRATFLVHFASEMQIWGGNVSNLYIDVWANSGLRLDLPSGTAVDAVGISSTDSWIAMSGDFGGGQGSLDARWGSSVLMANWGADTASFEDNFTVTLGYSALLTVSDGVAGYILNCNDSLEPRQVSHGTVCLEPGSSVGSSVVP